MRRDRFAIVLSLLFSLSAQAGTGSTAESPIPWSEAERLLLSGRVASVVQYHSGALLLKLDDGRTVPAEQSHLDQVIQFLEAHDLKERIPIATE